MNIEWILSLRAVHTVRLLFIHRNWWVVKALVPPSSKTFIESTQSICRDKIKLQSQSHRVNGSLFNFVSCILGDIYLLREAVIVVSFIMLVLFAPQFIRYFLSKPIPYRPLVPEQSIYPCDPADVPRQTAIDLEQLDNGSVLGDTKRKSVVWITILKYAFKWWVKLIEDVSYFDLVNRWYTFFIRYY